MQPRSSERIHYEYSTSAEDAYFRRERFNHVHDAVQRAVLLLGGGLTTLLTIRFFMALLDANTGNSLVSFVNNLSTPFVMPFYGLFHYDHASLGAISFQGYTLVAMVAYSLLIGGLAKLVAITRY
jgi:hypothetical protein